MCILLINTVPLCVRDLSIHGFWVSGRVLHYCSRVMRGQLYSLKWRFHQNFGLSGHGLEISHLENEQALQGINIVLTWSYLFCSQQFEPGSSGQWDPKWRQSLCLLASDPSYCRVCFLPQILNSRGKVSLILSLMQTLYSVQFTAKGEEYMVMVMRSGR